MLPSHQPSQALTSRPTGTYQIRLDHSGYTAHCVVYRLAPGQRIAKVLTHVQATTTRAALAEARRNVRIARKAGGL